MTSITSIPLSTYARHSDDDLLKAIRRNDEKAFAELFNRNWKKAHTIAYSKVHDKQVTEEIVQDLFVTLWDKRATLSIVNINSYIYTSIRNKALNYIESCIVKKKYWDYYKKFVPQTASLTEEMVEYNELEEAIKQGMERLPKKTKRIFQLNRMEGRSIAEIAKLLNLSEKAIEYHLTNSLKHMRMHVKDLIISLCCAAIGLECFL
jgi:RNA polymerase sigma-70 factor (family 1)